MFTLIPDAFPILTIYARERPPHDDDTDRISLLLVAAFIPVAVMGGLSAPTFSFISRARSLPLPAFAVSWTWLDRLHDRRSGVPYGIALAAAGVMVDPNSPLWHARVVAEA